jgi:hypothetical protein
MGRSRSLEGQAALTTLARWLLVPLSAIAVWYAVFLLGFAGIGLLDHFCPPDLVVSGACTASWHYPAVEVLILLCTALVSVGIVLVPALVAPAKRLHVAALAYGCGAAFAIYAASGGSLWGPFAAAALCGSGALWFAAARWRGPGRSA